MSPPRTLTAKLAVACAVSLLISPPAWPADRVLELSAEAIGTMQTPLTGGIVLNRGSSLARIAIVVNDSTCPVRITPGTAIKAVWVPDRTSGDYKFTAKGFLVASELVAAVDVRFVLVDVFATHMNALRFVEVRDLQAGTSIQFDTSGATWRADEEDASTFGTSIAYVARVRRADGSIWTADRPMVEMKVAELNLSLGNTDEAGERNR